MIHLYINMDTVRYFNKTNDIIRVEYDIISYLLV